MTSNIGAELIDFSNEQKNEIEVYTKEKIMEEVRKNFKPEFLNRIDDLIIFNRLTKKDINRIIEIQINNLCNILKKKKISIKLDEKSKKWIVDEGFSSTYGARPLKRLIQTEIIDKIAHLILSNDLKEGSTLSLSTNKINELIINYD